MRKSTSLFLLILLLTFLAPLHISGEEDFYRYNILFTEELDASLIEKYDGTIHHEFDTIAAVTATLSTQNVKKLLSYEQIKLIEKDLQVELQYQQIDWGVTIVKAPEAWSTGVTGKGIKVAVIDSGIDRNHPDLKVNEGISVVSYTSSFADDHGHGTHVAGTIAALNNHYGVAGIAPEADLYVVKALDQEGNGHHSDVAKGIEWAIEKEVDIINLSFGSETGSIILEKALDQAFEKGILLVGAAGNRGTIDGNSHTVDYPAAYPNVIAVAAINQQNQRAEFSGTGAEVEVAAPGEKILSTMRNRQYGYASGTSMAAPHVAGILALFKEANPSLDHLALRELLWQNTIDLGIKGRDTFYGYGLVQVPEQLTIKTYEPPPSPTNFRATLNEQYGKTIVNLSWNAAEGKAKITNYRIYRNQQLIATIGQELQYRDTLYDNGEYSYEVVAVDENDLISLPSNSYNVKINIQKESPFTDVSPNAWYFPHLIYLYNQGYVAGFVDGQYKPEANITRAEVVTMIGRILNLNGQQRETVFSDVRKEYYAAGFIQSGYENNLMYGYADGTFGPMDLVSRGEVASFLARAFPMPSYRAAIEFTDVDKNYFAYYDIRTLSAAKVAAGYEDGTYQPRKPISRAEFTVFLARTINDQFKLQ